MFLLRRYYWLLLGNGDFGRYSFVSLCIYNGYVVLCVIADFYREKYFAILVEYATIMSHNSYEKRLETEENERKRVRKSRKDVKSG
jgi:hypothetical protein